MGFALKFNTHKMHALTERNYTMRFRAKPIKAMEWQCTALMNFVSYIFSHHANANKLSVG